MLREGDGGLSQRDTGERKLRKKMNKLTEKIACSPATRRCRRWHLFRRTFPALNSSAGASFDRAHFLLHGRRRCDTGSVRARTHCAHTRSTCVCVCIHRCTGVSQATAAHTRGVYDSRLKRGGGENKQIQFTTESLYHSTTTLHQKKTEKAIDNA